MGRLVAWSLVGMVGQGCAVGDGASSGTLGPGALLDTGTAAGGTGDDDGGDPSDTHAANTTGEGGTDTGGGEGPQDTATPCEERFWYPDVDGDGRGDPNAPLLACDMPPGHVGNLDDCDDNDQSNAPSLDETCDGKDNDCDGLVDELSDSNAACNGCALAVDGDHAYALCPEPATFDAARVTCQLFAGDLVKVETAEEITFLVGVPLPPSLGVGGYLIGLNDRATEGQYVWTDDTVAVFTEYNAGEPNDAAGAEDCTEMSPATGTWNDVPCEVKGNRSFICESVAP